MVGDISKTFYAELKPISEKYIERAVNVSGLSLDQLKQNGMEPAHAMKEFESWIKSVCGEENRPVFVAFNATFDWSFVNYYFHRFSERNPFGISGLDIKAYCMGMKACSWGETTKRKLDQRFKSKRKHTHNALDDAIEQAEIFEKMLKSES